MGNQTSWSWLYGKDGDVVYHNLCHRMLNVKQVEPGKPERFCAPMDSVANGCTLYTTAYPVAWRIEIVDDDAHRGFEYVRSEHDIARPIRTAH